MRLVGATKRYDKAFVKLSADARAKALKAIELFAQNPRHPSLDLKKRGASGRYFFRVDRNFRIVLEEVGDGEFDLFDIGDHDYVDRIYG